MPRPPHGAPHRSRPEYRTIPQWAAILILRGFRATAGVRHVIGSLFTSHDPWEILRVFKIRNWWPIEHEPRRGRPTRSHYTAHQELYAGEEPFDVDILDVDILDVIRSQSVEPTWPIGATQTRAYVGTARPQPSEDVPPLGPDDYEVGLRVTVEPEPGLEALWINMPGWTTVDTAYRALGLRRPSR